MCVVNRRALFKVTAFIQLSFGIGLVFLQFIDMGVVFSHVAHCRGAGLLPYYRYNQSAPIDSPDNPWGDYETYTVMYEPDCTTFYTQRIVTVVMAPLWCGAMFIVTGALGMGALRSKIKSRTLGLTNGYMLMSVLSGMFFAPTLTFVAAIDFFLSGNVSERVPGDEVPVHSKMTLDIVMCLIGVTEMVVSVVAGSVSCCCPPLNTGDILMEELEEEKPESSRTDDLAHIIP